MVGSAGEVQLGVNVQLGLNVRNGKLKSLIALCTQSPLHEYHMSFCMMWYDFGFHMKKTCRAPLI